MLPATLLKGEFYELSSEVHNDGLLNHYTIRSEFGDFMAVSNTLLKIRLREVEAIAAMRQVDTSGATLQGLKQSGKKTFSGAKNLIVHPIETIGGAAEGAGEMFQRSTSRSGRKASDTEDSKFEQLIGLSKARGVIASRYGVNVYSQNLVLQKELDRLARANYFGGMGIRVLTSIIPGVNLMLSTSNAARALNESINTMSASEIWSLNKRKLQGMKLALSEAQLELFLNNPVFNPALQTVLVTMLVALTGVENRELFIQLSIKADSSVRARMLTELSVMAARYHKNISPIARFTPMAKLLSAVLSDRSVLILLPVDYVLWTENFSRVAEFMTARARQLNKGTPALWLMGRVSRRTRAELHARGWKVRPEAGSLLKVRKSSKPVPALQRG